MFPPASPLTERVRIANEQREFERELEQRAMLEQTGTNAGIIRRAYRWLACRLQSRAATPQPRSMVTAKDPCAKNYS